MDAYGIEESAMRVWWLLRHGRPGMGWRFTHTPLHWPIGFAATWYGNELAFGWRRGDTDDFYKWSIDLLSLAVHGWVSR